MMYPNPPTRWAPTSYKWSYNPYKWPYNWVTGVITLLIEVVTPLVTSRGPPLQDPWDLPGFTQVDRSLHQSLREKNLSPRWFKPWPFHPPFGGHQQPFKMVTFSPSQKGHNELPGPPLFFGLSHHIFENERLEPEVICHVSTNHQQAMALLEKWASPNKKQHTTQIGQNYLLVSSWGSILGDPIIFEPQNWVSE